MMTSVRSSVLLVLVCACDAMTNEGEQATSASETTSTAHGSSVAVATGSLDTGSSSHGASANGSTSAVPDASDITDPDAPTSTLDGGGRSEQGPETSGVSDEESGSADADESDVSNVGDSSALDSTDGDSEDPVELDGEPTQMSLVDLPTVRQEHGVVALDGEIYVLGGFTPDVTASVQAYSPDTNAWRDVADFPVQFHHPNVSAVDGRVYVTGFLLGASLRDGDGRVFSYAPGQDEWSEHAPMNPGTERGSACVTSLGSKIYVFGGAASNTVPDASAYDTVLDEWEELPFLPELREHCVAAAVGDKLYIVSGRANGIGGVLTESYEFDPVTNVYTERAPIPTARGGTAGAVLGGRIFVFGGEGNDNSDSGVFGQVEAYDPSTDTWQAFPDMLLPRHGFGAATVGSRIYLPGGGDVQGFGSVEDFTVLYFQPTND